MSDFEEFVPIEVDEFESIPLEVERRRLGRENERIKKFRICKKSTCFKSKALSLGKTSFDFYNVRVEKNGQEINIDRQINEITSTSNKNIFVDINFKLTENIDIDPPVQKYMHQG